MAILSTLNWKDEKGIAPNDSNERGHLALDMSSNASWIKDNMKVVLNAARGFDLRSTIAYNLACAAEFPTELTTETITEGVINGAEPYIGINVIRYSTHCIFEAAGVHLEVRASDIIPAANIQQVLGGAECAGVYLAVADKIWAALLKDEKALSKLCQWNKESSVCIIANTLHRYGDERHNWKTETASRRGTLANKILDLAGANKENMAIFMERFGHDMWHYLTDICLLRISYILAGYPDYGVRLEHLPASEVGIIEMYRILPAEDDVEPKVPMVDLSKLTTSIPVGVDTAGDETGSIADEDDDDAPPVFPEVPATSLKSPARKATKEPRIKGGVLSKEPSKPDDDDSLTSGGSRYVLITDLIVVGQAAADRFPPGVFGISALITGMSMVIAQIRHIGSKVVVANLADILAALTSTLVQLKTKKYVRADLLNLKNALQNVIIQAYGYCKEVPELADSAMSFQSLVNFAKRDNNEETAGSILAKRVREIEADPKAVEAMIKDVFGQVTAAIAAANDTTEDADAFQVVPAAADFRVFRTIAQLNNEQAIATARAAVAAAATAARDAEGA